MIVDDHPLVRQGLRTALETPGLVCPAGIEVKAEAGNGLDAITETKLHQPDLLLLDIAMPLAGGTEVLHDLQRWSPDTRIVVLTGLNSGNLISQLLELGVAGLFYKGEDLQHLYAQLPLILQGGRHIAPAFEQVLLNLQDTQVLTAREQQILNMIVAGKTNKDMANQLFISPKTIDKHRTSLMQKLGVHSVAELIVYALREGLVDAEQLF